MDAVFIAILSIIFQRTIRKIGVAGLGGGK